MAGVSYSLKFDAVKAVQGLARIERAEGDLFPLMDRIGAQLEQSARDRIERSNVSPEGIPWKPSARAKREGTPTLFKSGQLAASITHVADAKSTTVGTNKVYARIHQTGGDIKREARSQDIYRRTNKARTRFTMKGRFVKRSKSNFAQTVNVGAHTISMPARPYLGVSREDGEAIVRLSVAHFDIAARGTGP